MKVFWTGNDASLDKGSIWFFVDVRKPNAICTCGFVDVRKLYAICACGFVDVETGSFGNLLIRQGDRTHFLTLHQFLEGSMSKRLSILDWKRRVA